MKQSERERQMDKGESKQGINKNNEITESEEEERDKRQKERKLLKEESEKERGGRNSITEREMGEKREI